MKTVFFDIDTQFDFLLPAGALYAPGAERLMPTLAALNRFAVGRHFPLISTMDAHAENDAEFLHWPPHCVADTTGQQKPQALLVSRTQVIPARKKANLQTLTPQILLEKDKLDCFTNHHLPDLLNKLDAQRYVVYGVVTEHCVRMAASGLLRHGGQVEIVTDAIQGLAAHSAAETLSKLQAAGARLVTAAEVML
jgi:nicotinamidase/pyrazinamidase